MHVFWKKPGQTTETQNFGTFGGWALFSLTFCGCGSGFSPQKCIPVLLSELQGHESYYMTASRVGGTPGPYATPSAGGGGGSPVTTTPGTGRNNSPTAVPAAGQISWTDLPYASHRYG